MKPPTPEQIAAARHHAAKTACALRAMGRLGQHLTPRLNAEMRRQLKGRYLINLSLPGLAQLKALADEDWLAALVASPAEARQIARKAKWRGRMFYKCFYDPKDMNAKQTISLHRLRPALASPPTPP